VRRKRKIGRVRRRRWGRGKKRGVEGKRWSMRHCYLLNEEEENEDISNLYLEEGRVEC
jgi:hypothetical protein